MTIHVATHGDALIPCPVDGCDHMFKHKAYIAKHMHINHNPSRSRLHKCTWPGCTYTAFQKSDLKIHVSDIHEKLHKHVCSKDGCGATFVSKWRLYKHVKLVHDKVFNHVCTEEGCDKRFWHLQSMKEHVDSVHKNIRPHVCSYPGCNWTSAYASHLVSHVQYKHLNKDRPVKCTEESCAFTCMDAATLKKHIEAIHTLAGAQRQKKSEEILAKFLKDNGIEYTRETHVDFRCTEKHGDHFARLDFFLLRNGVIIIIENDEYQHRGIATVCEVKRMAEIVETWAVGGNTIPIVFIRYNPHGFTLDGLKPKVPQHERLQELLSIIEDDTHPIYDKTRPLKIMHMFYDTKDSIPKVVEDYGHLKDCVIDCVVKTST